MRYIITFLLTGLVFFSACNDQGLTKVVTETFEDSSPKMVLYYSIHDTDSVLIKSSEYHPNRMLYIEGSYKNNVRDGEWKSWYDNGILWSEGYFKNGVQTGISKTYYENGQLRYSGEFKNGKRIGTWHFYDENGRMVKEIKY